MAKKQKSPLLKVGFNGTPFTKERYEQLTVHFSTDNDLRFVWGIFNEFYSSSVKLAYRELLETQSFFVGLLGEARTKFTSIEDKSDIDLAEEMVTWVKCLQSISDGINSMRATMISAEQALEIESSVTSKAGEMSLIDELAINTRKTQKEQEW
jgi:hypothetical protein